LAIRDEKEKWKNLAERECPGYRAVGQDPPFTFVVL
jgi:hypothetical protein